MVYYDYLMKGRGMHLIKSGILITQYVNNPYPNLYFPFCYHYLFIYFNKLENKNTVSTSINTSFAKNIKSEHTRVRTYTYLPPFKLFPVTFVPYMHVSTI